MRAAAPVTDDAPIAMIVEQTDRLLERNLDGALLEASEAGEWPAGLWAEAVANGLHLAMVPEAAGGIGLDAGPAALLIRRLAYHSCPLPLADTIVAATLWSAAGLDLPDGPLVLAAGPIASPAAPWADRTAGIALAGEAGSVRLLREGQWEVGARTRNVANEPRHAIVPVPGGAARNVSAAADPLLLGAYVRAQQMVGAMERALDHALAYANERKQFGRALSKFQAIQNMLAEAAGQVAAARAAGDLAARHWDGPLFPLAVSIAKARIGEAAGKVAAVAHQVHGAMGFTREHMLHFSTRRLWAWRDEYGNDAYWQERVGREICRGGGAAFWPAIVAMSGNASFQGKTDD